MQPRTKTRNKLTSSLTVEPELTPLNSQSRIDEWGIKFRPCCCSLFNQRGRLSIEREIWKRDAPSGFDAKKLMPWEILRSVDREGVGTGRTLGNPLSRCPLERLATEHRLGTIG